MSNPSKQIGTKAETAVTRYAQANGYPWADRQPPRGRRDQGDLTLTPGIIIEVKAHKTAATGQPGRALLTSWMGQTEVERVNAGADVGLLIVKRAGTTDVGQWWAYLTLAGFVGLVGGGLDVGDRALEPVCLPVASALALLTEAGWTS